MSSVIIKETNIQKFYPFCVAHQKEISRMTRQTNRATINTKNEQILDSYWTIPDIPEHFSLERSSLKMNKKSFNQVMDRLNFFLLSRFDMKCSYHMSDGRIDCRVKTGDSSTIKFIIQLWKCSMQNHRSNSSEGFILEVQRRRGCSIEMKIIRKELFQAVLFSENTASEQNCIRYDKEKTFLLSCLTDLPKVPDHYLLERSSIRICKAFLDIAVIRLIEFFCDNSIIESSYDVEFRRINCRITTNDGVLLKFIIRFWKCHEGDNNDEDESFILEIQRRKGCSIKMKNIRINLFRAILYGRAINAQRKNHSRESSSSMLWQKKM